jgi:hypothetical protein
MKLLSKLINILITCNEHRNKNRTMIEYYILDEYNQCAISWIPLSLADYAPSKN